VGTLDDDTVGGDESGAGWEEPDADDLDWGDDEESDDSDSGDDDL